MTSLSNSLPGDIINHPNFVSLAIGLFSCPIRGFVSVLILAYSPLPRTTESGFFVFVVNVNASQMGVFGVNCVIIGIVNRQQF